MTEHKFTDEEVIKALAFHAYGNGHCLECPIRIDGCSSIMASLALKLINRQKAEIEKLREKYDRARFNLQAVLDERADHSEAIKEFAHILKHKMFEEDFLLCEPCVMADIIDNLVKEMVGEQDV